MSDKEESRKTDNGNVTMPEITLSCAAKRLLTWYEENRRTLPWRDDPSPYHVWLSEIMLQQTRVETVKGYYERFLNNIPDMETLARFPEDELLKLWEGLGYYNRVRNMQKAAIRIVDHYGGRMPSSYEEILSLPGIGAYTAGAIASMAYGQAVAAVDGNVLRVCTRLLLRDDDIGKESFKTEIKKVLEDVIQDVDGKENRDKSCAGALNQALMDLGAMVCVPGTSPACIREGNEAEDGGGCACPLSDICRAHALHREAEFPNKAKKPDRKIEKKTVLILSCNDRILIHKRPETGLLAGLYELPSLEGWAGRKRVLSYAKELGFNGLKIEILPDSKHIFSHREWHMRAYMIRADELSADIPVTDKDENFLLAESEVIRNKYPIPSAFSAYREYL